MRNPDKTRELIGSDVPEFLDGLVVAFSFNGVPDIARSGCALAFDDPVVVGYSMESNRLRQGG